MAKPGTTALLLPVLELDPLLYVRPAPRASILFARAPELRVEKRSIPPLKTKTVRYRVRGKRLRQPGKYTVCICLKFRNLPPHVLARLGAPRPLIDHVNRADGVFVEIRKDTDDKIAFALPAKRPVRGI